MKDKNKLFFNNYFEMYYVFSISLLIYSYFESPMTLYGLVYVKILILQADKSLNP